ncbi:hypothetical protein [Actinacidiphila bryophytorum]|uniref:hypothetical protein n=1 Tax=Actinacidiphila bryophytorum TaxID=1436133 RepID=UPI002176D588|nr:hypothetical protein [Actinacidiphila bryophytorum]UWE11019.1 hypothetical protein NYE86_21410 [Actinacidiphila bryophytorum]
MTTRRSRRRPAAVLAAAGAALLLAAAVPQTASAATTRTLQLALTCSTGLPYGLSVDNGSGWYYPDGSSYASGLVKYFTVFIPSDATEMAINTGFCDNQPQTPMWEGYRYAITPGTSTISANGNCQDMYVYPGPYVRYCSLTGVTYS